MRNLIGFLSCTKDIARHEYHDHLKETASVAFSSTKRSRIPLPSLQTSSSERARAFVCFLSWYRIPTTYPSGHSLTSVDTVSPKATQHKSPITDFSARKERTLTQINAPLSLSVVFADLYFSQGLWYITLSGSPSFRFPRPRCHGNLV